ncbi:hypothetical protein AYI68_g3829 [Smittium mucronatum]|uniref:Uncharacterized protein n=1 Tax=Smittium mucronatum TaxID=133383 RepID=A0A1R0GNJ6_9FUNG|nr:hypothetical protein AYI68_g7501 [Smittium mucronatum]OLY82057.1 hypothetical protein AYI68_g3829 [Smittium mucronatum]
MMNNKQEPYRGLEPELNESINKENTRFSMAGSPAKSTNASKSPLSSKALIEIDTETSLSLSYATSHQASISGANPYG